MGKLTVEDLQQIKERSYRDTALRYAEPKIKITVHMGECGIKAGARAVMEALLEEMGRIDRGDIHVLAGGCSGSCAGEPNVTIEAAGLGPVRYQKIDPEKMVRIFKKHVLEGEVQSDLTAPH